MKRFFYVVIVAVLVGGCATVDVAPSVAPDSNAWTEVLKSHVSPEGEIDFATLRQSPQQIDAAASHFAAVDLSAITDAQSRLALHINAYNALSMHLAVRSGIVPRKRVRFFITSQVEFAGKRVSLYNLENRIIRPLGDPRIHFALNCMVRDCPRLLQQPYDAAKLEAQLEAASREFINDERRVSFDAASNTVFLSKIFKWYKKDFGDSLIGYLNQYRQSAIPPNTKIKWLDYDWTLNQS